MLKDGFQIPAYADRVAPRTSTRATTSETDAGCGGEPRKWGTAEVEALGDEHQAPGSRALLVPGA